MRVGDQNAPRIRTMGQAEEMGYRLLAFGAGMVGVGILLSLTVVLIYLGAPLVMLGAMVVLGDILWMFAISRRMNQEVFCPHCHKANLVLDNVSHFQCDDCQERIELQPVTSPVSAQTAYRRAIRALRARARRGRA
jgi:hypothetical protein